MTYASALLPVILGWLVVSLVAASQGAYEPLIGGAPAFPVLILGVLSFDRAVSPDNRARRRH